MPLRKKITSNKKFASRYGKGSKKPSRLRVSKTRTAITTAVSKAISNNSENKFRGFEIECAQPVAIPSGTALQPISYHFFNTGKDLSAALPEYITPLDMFNFPQGTGNAERVGNNMYIKNGYITMNVQTLPKEAGSQITGDQPLIKFRLMMVKANRKYNPLGKFPVPGETLFLTPGNNSFGYYNSQSTHNFDMQSTNGREWLKYCDKRFTLSYPVVDKQFPLGTGTGQVNNAYEKYATSKTIRLKLPVMKKTHFDNDPNSDQFNHPDNLDTQWLIILQAMHPSYCTPNSRRPLDYVVNMNCTTVCQDN